MAISGSCWNSHSKQLPVYGSLDTERNVQLFHVSLAYWSSSVFSSAWLLSPSQEWKSQFLCLPHTEHTGFLGLLETLPSTPSSCQGIFLRGTGKRILFTWLHQLILRKCVTSLFLKDCCSCLFIYLTTLCSVQEYTGPTQALPSWSLHWAGETVKNNDLQDNHNLWCYNGNK